MNRLLDCASQERPSTSSFVCVARVRPVYVTITRSGSIDPCQVKLEHSIFPVMRSTGGRQRSHHARRNVLCEQNRLRMDEIEWRYQGNSVRVGMTWRGQGASVLMLPALSSISTRMEMWPLQERLGSRFTTLAIDWVGFGDRPRPALRWSPEIYRNFLAYLLNDVVPRPFATIAAGHAAGYCLDAAAARPGSMGRLCLIAPTSPLASQHAR